MALLIDPSKNFINALSSFWNSFFRDADDLRAYYDGVQINLGQIYLEMLQTVLGTSLEHMPLFSKYYYKYTEVSRSQLFYEEGASPSEDRYSFTPSSYVLAGADAFTNRVIRPTATLSKSKDFVIESGAVKFSRDLFNIDGAGTTEPLFPIRIQGELAPAVFTEPTGIDWVSYGVKIGDFFRLRVVGGGSPLYVRVIGISGAKLYLSQKLPEFTQNFATRTALMGVVRTPYDATRVGVPLPANATTLAPLGAAVTDGAFVPGTKTINVSAETFYKGAWTALTAYAQGDLVTNGGGTLYRAKVAHSSGASFDPNLWQSLLNNYLYVGDVNAATNCGLAKITAVSGGVITLDRVMNFVATATNRADFTFLDYGGTYFAGPQPVITLPQTFIEPGTLFISARRGHVAYSVGTTNLPLAHPAGESVVEGIDYIVDYEAGTITLLTGWDPDLLARANYQWTREVFLQTYVNETATLFTYDQIQNVPTMALWGNDLLSDESALFNNFGYLLDYKKPTSEQYRSFLRGVAQLFLLGPTLERFESAMNVMAEFPVVQNDDELLLSYDSGIVASGSSGSLIDSAQGRDGTTVAATATFSSPTADFFPSDLGARLFLRNGLTNDEYTVIEVTSATSVKLSPPPIDAVDVTWRYTHVVLTTRFRDTTGTYLFDPGDVGGVIRITGSNNARNNGIFPIVAVENGTTVVLETPYGFDDENNVTWSFSRNAQQIVTTSENTYAFPLQAKIRADVKDPANAQFLTFRAFESLTESFLVVDYVRDPTWWHDVAIPQELLQLDVESAGRRQVSSSFIDHVYGALDTAVYGDFGMAYGVDDEAMPGQARRGAARWFGSNSIVLNFASGTPLANNRDVGQYVVVHTPGFKGFYEIKSVASNSITLTLDRFPPPEAEFEVPPVDLDVELPPLLVRRTVAFFMMDRFLKYHAVRLRIDKDTPLPTDFLTDVTRLITEAKPSETYIYLDSVTDFVDRMQLTDSFLLGYGPYYTEPLWRVNNNLVYGPGSPVRYGDAFRYVETTSTVPGAAGTYSLPVVLPGGNVEYTLVKLRFDPSVLVAGGTRRPAEGVDYTLDYFTTSVIIPAGATFPVGPNPVQYVYCIRRIRTDSDPLDPGETRQAYGSTDPTIYRAPAQPAWEMGLVDRAVQITLGP
jgi:hypothetical protein